MVLFVAFTICAFLFGMVMAGFNVWLFGCVVTWLVVTCLRVILVCGFWMLMLFGGLLLFCG